MKSHIKVSLDIPAAIFEPQMDYQNITAAVGQSRRLRRTDAATTGALV